MEEEDRIVFTIDEVILLVDLLSASYFHDRNVRTALRLLCAKLRKGISQD